jgi:hypothetical protein
VRQIRRCSDLGTIGVPEHSADHAAVRCAIDTATIGSQVQDHVVVDDAAQVLLGFIARAARVAACAHDRRLLRMTAFERYGKWWVLPAGADPGDQIAV